MHIEPNRTRPGFPTSWLHAIRAMHHPERYHGFHKNRHFFEGWYFKVVNASEAHKLAFIAGIARDKAGEGEAFVQVLDGAQNQSTYHAFDLSEFRITPGQFDLTNGANRFNATGIRLDLPEIQGELHFQNQVTWPKKWYAPGIMGPLSFVPFLQCYHGLLSLDHDLHGALQVDGRHVDFSAGKGYTEKDWGKSFPSAHVWMQCNHFETPATSIKVALARVPLLHRTYTGFAVALWYNTRWYTFSSYNFTRLRRSSIKNSNVSLVLENRKYRLEIEASGTYVTPLVAPRDGTMNMKVSESMQAHMRIKLTARKSGAIILEDTGRNVCLEVAGEYGELQV